MGWSRLWCALVLLSSTTSADELSEAREHYRKGTLAFELGAYEEAISEYSQAYRLKDDPVILYNLAQANRLADHTTEALHLYRSYLSKVPNAQNRDEVLAKIEALQKLIEDRRRAHTLPPDTTLPRPAEAGPSPSPEPLAAPTEPPKPTTIDQGPRRGGLRLSGIAVGAVGLGAVVGGIACLVLAHDASDSLSLASNSGQPFDRSLYDRGKNESVAGGVLLGIGSVAVAAGVIMAVVGSRHRRGGLAFVPWINQDGAGLVFEVTP
jgi:tetratricopeptide (TPR) repeat protein